MYERILPIAIVLILLTSCRTHRTAEVYEGTTDIVAPYSESVKKAIDIAVKEAVSSKLDTAKMYLKITQDSAFYFVEFVPQIEPLPPNPDGTITVHAMRGEVVVVDRQTFKICKVFVTK